VKTPERFEDFRFLRSVVEVRFPRAHKYWDGSGQTIEAIEQRLPGLTCEKLEEAGFRFSAKEATGLSSVSVLKT